MELKHQINLANAYNNNLDISISRLVRNGSISLISTLTLHPTKWMANLEVCTLYDRKNRTNSYDFLRIKRVNTLFLSVSFKPIFVDFTLLIYMLPLLQFSIAMVVRLIFYILHTVQTL
jgi:hypothetical protein